MKKIALFITLFTAIANIKSATITIPAQYLTLYNQICSTTIPSCTATSCSCNGQTVPVPTQAIISQHCTSACMNEGKAWNGTGSCNLANKTCTCNCKN